MERPEVARKFALGLFYGMAFHDVAFTRVGRCDVVRLYDWELHMRKVSRSFFPEESVVRDMDIRAENVGVLEADIGSATDETKDDGADDATKGDDDDTHSTFGDVAIDVPTVEIRRSPRFAGGTDFTTVTRKSTAPPPALKVHLE